jgi:aryl-alcohol dehydrogenase-like predicted oxidoreductase
VSDFLYRAHPKLGKPVHRLGICTNYGIDGPGMAEALERGQNYVFWTQLRSSKATAPLREALRRDRERLVVATGPSIGYFGGSLRRATESALRTLGTDYIDVLHLFWLGKTSAWTEATLDAMRELKASGKVRAFGVSIHDRKRAATLVRDVDVLMIRYNAAHPGAERDIFPSVEAARADGEAPAVVAYTATSWRKLLRKADGAGVRPTAAQCYRFCLSSPSVDVVLSGPATTAQMRENLDGVAAGPLTAAEIALMTDVGKKAA